MPEYLLEIKLTPLPFTSFPVRCSLIVIHLEAQTASLNRPEDFVDGTELAHS
jgi:hypothetical protein